MAVMRCKMCSRSFDSCGALIAFCSFCGSRQTLPLIEEDRLGEMYDKGERLRFSGMYAEAENVFAQIAAKTPSEPEAYWRIALCRYGINYVNDLSVNKYVPKIDKMQNAAITDDIDYKKTLYYADENRKKEYEREANLILTQQKNIFAKRSNVYEVNTGNAHGLNNTSEQNNMSSVSADSMVKRMYMFLEDGKWQDADNYANRILDICPENPDAYLGKLLAELHVCRKEDLKSCAYTFDSRNSYKRCIRYADEALRAELEEYNGLIAAHNREARLAEKYNEAMARFNTAKNEEDFKHAADIFMSLGQFRDSQQKTEKCYECAEACVKTRIYRDACRLMEKDNAVSYAEALKLLKQIPAWKDSDKLIEICETAIFTQINENENADAVNKKTFRVIKYMLLALTGITAISSLAAAVIFLVLGLF